MKIKILLSARDPGAAFNILTLYEILKRSGQFDVYIAASRPAFDIIASKCVQPYPFIFRDRETDVFFEGDPKASLFDLADKVLKLFSPDFVITGLSSYGAGIDEALIARSPVKTAVFQDFWGDLNLSLLKTPDIVFTMDSFASKLTEKRFGDIKCQVTGHPKLFHLKQKNISALLEKIRNDFDIHEQSVISFFDQPLFIPGREEIISCLMDMLKKSENKGRIIFFYKGHPKYREEGAEFMAFVRKEGLNAFDISSYLDPMPFLAVSDVVTTMFSSCTTDHALLTFVSDDVSGIAVSLMNRSVKEYYKSVSGLDKLPLLSMNIGEYLDMDSDNIQSLIDLAGDETKKNEYKNNCNRYIKEFSMESFISILNENL